MGSLNMSGSVDRGIMEFIDQHGNRQMLKGQGFRTSAINEMRDTREKYRVWVEDIDPKLGTWLRAWQSKSRKNPATLEDCLRLRDAAYPKGRVVEWVGTDDGAGVWFVHYAGKRFAVVNDSCEF